MPGITQPTEYPATFQDKFNAMMAQAKSRMGRKFTAEFEKEYEVVIKKALIREAEDKIEYSLRGQIRRGKPKKMGMSEDEFSEVWRKRMKERLIRDGYPFELTEAEQKILDQANARQKSKAMEEKTAMAAEAIKKLIQ